MREDLTFLSVVLGYLFAIFLIAGMGAIISKQSDSCANHKGVDKVHTDFSKRVFCVDGANYLVSQPSK